NLEHGIRKEENKKAFHHKLEAQIDIPLIRSFCPVSSFGPKNELLHARAQPIKTGWRKKKSCFTRAFELEYRGSQEKEEKRVKIK
ncbi:Hypothetical protein FKW44_011140, partial [Caligus rogercresseyi]